MCIRDRSWPSWLTCCGRLTHVSGHPSAAGRAQDSWTVICYRGLHTEMKWKHFKSSHTNNNNNIVFFLFPVCSHQDEWHYWQFISIPSVSSRWCGKIINCTNIKICWVFPTSTTWHLGGHEHCIQMPQLDVGNQTFSLNSYITLSSLISLFSYLTFSYSTNILVRITRKKLIVFTIYNKR